MSYNVLNVPGLDHPDASVDWGHGITVEQLDSQLKNKLAGMGHIFLAYSNIYKVNPALMAAVCAHETGNGTSSAIRNKNNAYGMMDPKTGSKTLMVFSSLQEGIRKGISNLSRNYIAKGKKELSSIGAMYCPIGAANDPGGLNVHWIPKVGQWFTTFSGKSYSPLLAGTGVKNEQLEPVEGGLNGGIVGDGTGSPPPNFDNREDWENLTEIKGVILTFLTPQHLFSVAKHKEEWEKDKYDREVHFGIDSKGLVALKDDKKITQSMQDNNKSTYINRALFKNKAIKHCISVGIFTSQATTDYSITEKRIIRDVARVLHKYNLETKDLWREFDLNREASPLLYLDRTVWKTFLREVDKQLMFLQATYPQQKKDRYEEHVGKMCKITSSIVNVLDLPEQGANSVAQVKQDEEYKIKDYSNTWYQLEAPLGWIEVRHAEPILDEEKTPETRTPEEDKVDIKFPEIDEAIMPEIADIISHDQYLVLLEHGSPTRVDNYAGWHEPYDKNLPEIIEAKITDDERMQSLTNKVTSLEENELHYSIAEASPGDGDHCKRAASEMNGVWKSEQLKVEPMYPDLIIPPKYNTADQNLSDPNALPPGIFSGTGVINDYLDKDKDWANEDADMYKISMFDYKKVKEKQASKGKPVNYSDPYPYDDKIRELEQHHPKVKIDEIESRLYDCNHIGCPIGQPMAKNFHMLNNASIAQSKKTEQRLVKLENTLSFVMRNLGRLGSRMHINCVYYGGQDTFGKYKTIRCLKDDRLDDGCSMTIDQCMACTRYEPILGQIYEILDATGINGSYITDDEHMSYNNAVAFNHLEYKSIEDFADLSDNSKHEKYSSMVDLWKDIDKEDFINSLKEKYEGEELENKIKAIKEHEYMFKMDWDESILETQEPDVKAYPTEGIKAKYKVKPIGDDGEDVTEEDDNSKVKTKPEDNGEEDKTDEDKPPIADDDNFGDNDVDKDKEEYDKLVEGEWVDTREKADTYEINKYTSEEFFFDGFGTNINVASTSVPNNNILGQSSNELRNKITEMALKIVDDHVTRKKAWYSQEKRTSKYVADLPENKDKDFYYDCSSFVSCCYHNAGLTEFANGTTETILTQARQSGAEMWIADAEGKKKALPGDVILIGKGEGGEFKPTHAVVWIAEDEWAHASTGKSEHPKQIRHDKKKLEDYRPGDTKYFCRSAEMAKKDKETSNVLGSGQFAWPVPDSMRLTSPFGQRNISYGSKNHKGIDIGATPAGSYGDKIVASDAGTVTIASTQKGYGKVIYIDHGNGYSTRYAHLNNYAVNKGDKVEKGQHIGDMGATGGNYAVHLHFEIRKGETALNPEDFLKGIPYKHV